MGKGDKKTKKGKIAQGSYGVSRPRKGNQQAASANQQKQDKNKQP